MDKIIVYTGEGFTGRSAEFYGNVPNLAENDVNDKILSVIVVGAPWVAYYDVDFLGKHRLFEQGEYPTLVDKGQFSSLRMITENLENPELQLFKDSFFKGRSMILKREMNLHQVDFADEASSHKVKSGVWVLYEDIDRGGRQLVSFPGEEVPNYCEVGFNDVISHVRPLLSPKTTETTFYVSYNI